MRSVREGPCVRRQGAVTWRKAALNALVVSLLLLVYGPALAGDAEDRQFVETLLSGSEPQADWFSDGFLQQVPLAQVGQIVRDIQRRYGEATRVSGEAGEFVAWTRTHRIPVLLERDPAGRIVGLFFRAAEPIEVNFYQTLHALRSLPGEVAYVIQRDRGVLASHQADEALAVGSSFKLAVLQALRSRIERGDARWDDVLRLEPQQMSLVNGFLQDMPAGSPLTLHSLAVAMIAQSDNTATDTLIAYIGRGAVEAVAGLSPLLTTREVFQLKADPELYEDYAGRNLEGRRRLLEELAGRPLPRLGQVTGTWRAEAEWLISARDLCRLMSAVGDLEITQINPGPVSKAGWRKVAYKGGSETGVLNMTTLATDAEGESYCVAATWNDATALDEARFAELYRSLLLALRDRWSSLPRNPAMRAEIPLGPLDCCLPDTARNARRLYDGFMRMAIEGVRLTRSASPAAAACGRGSRRRATRRPGRRPWLGRREGRPDRSRS